MIDWTAGYVAEINYTFGYYTELNPFRFRLPLLNAGFSFPEIETACELGFGQGLSANIHAAASSATWYGTDFNPSQAAFAQELAQAADTNTKLYDQAFEDFCSREDLPDFDFIALHGIWSWISDENRAVIVDFVRRKLKVGGLLYISYNTLPGWTPAAPLRHLMVEHSGAMGSESQGSHGRINAALDFVSRLLSLEPLYTKANPGAAPRFEKLTEQDRNYLAHEYFNRDWVPMYFSQVAEHLSSAKLDYATSANYLDAVEAINLTQPQRELLSQIPAQGFRQTVRDYCVNQQFRKDYWIKGARRLSRIEQMESIRELKFVLAVPQEDIQFKVTGALGEATLNENIYKAVINYLSDYKIRTFSQIEKDLQAHQIGFAQILEVFMILCSDGRIALVQEEAVINKAKKHTLKLNAHLIQKARFGSDISYLASPVTGGGVVVNRFNQLFLLAINNGKKTPAEWAQLAWSILSSQGQSLVKEGKTLETVEENLAELTSQAVSFSQKTLPILKLMQIV